MNAQLVYRIDARISLPLFVQGARAKLSYELHKGAHHGYALHDRDIHD